MSRDPLKLNQYSLGDLSLLSGSDRSVAFVRLPLDPLESDRHRFVMELWRERRGSRVAPCRRDFDPWDLKPVLPMILLVDVLQDPLDFRYRLSGTKVRDIHGMELTGHRVRDLMPRLYAEKVWQDYSELVERKAPQLCEIEYINRFDLKRCFKVLRLPLSSDGDSVDMIMAVHHVE